MATASYMGSAAAKAPSTPRLADFCSALWPVFAPPLTGRKAPIEFDEDQYRQRNLIERMFGRLKDWRRIATRYDRCAHTFMSAICIAATVIFWL